MRDYKSLIRQLEGLAGDAIRLEVLAQIDGYPVYCAECSRDPGHPTALLLAGTHGDEPAGVEAALTFLQQVPEEWRQRFNFEVIPCLNPQGYVRHTRHNAQGVDVNWAYARDDVPEVQGFRRFVAGRRFQFVMDFHEDWESPGYYIYELCRGRPLIGHEVARQVSQFCPINTSPIIEGLTAIGGVISPDAEQEVERRGAGIPLAMFFAHTDHLLTSESPTRLALERRVKAHLVALRTVVEAHLAGR